MRETWVQSLGREDSLEKGMATHSSILAWRIPWTEEPGGPQSMGSQRVGYNWATSLSLSLKKRTEQNLLDSERPCQPARLGVISEEVMLGETWGMRRRLWNNLEKWPLDLRSGKWHLKADELIGQKYQKDEYVPVCTWVYVCMGVCVVPEWCIEVLGGKVQKWVGSAL